MAHLLPVMYLQGQVLSVAQAGQIIPIPSLIPQDLAEHQCFPSLADEARMGTSMSHSCPQGQSHVPGPAVRPCFANEPNNPDGS